MHIFPAIRPIRSTPVPQGAPPDIGRIPPGAPGSQVL